MSAIRRKVFISFHHDDQKEIEKFIEEFDEKKDIFISRALGMSSDIIDSNDTDYVMRRIRELYLKDTTVTLVMIGKCTWARRYIDWEIQASLRHGEKTIPNGLMGIRLPSYNKNRYPNRLNLNLKQSLPTPNCLPLIITSRSEPLKRCSNLSASSPLGIVLCSVNAVCSTAFSNSLSNLLKSLLTCSTVPLVSGYLGFTLQHPPGRIEVP